MQQQQSAETTGRGEGWKGDGGGGEGKGGVTDSLTTESWDLYTVRVTQ